MIVIKSIGGLGNQMFQYALYLKYKSMGREVSFDDSGYVEGEPVQFELGKFGVKYDKPGFFDTLRYRDPWRKIFGSKSFVVYDEKLAVGYQPEIYEIKKGCLKGYWQCEKYFKDIEAQIRDAYRFPDVLSDGCREMLEKISAVNATSVHIRRGDYLEPKNAKNYSGICTKEYYERAMAYIRERQPDTKFFFFSDDTKWVRENLCSDGDEVVECNHGEDNYLDMFLMSKCNNNIIANSSFSWWGAWLNEHPDKIVITPVRWFRHLEVSDAICDSWTRV